MEQKRIMKVLKEFGLKGVCVQLISEKHKRSVWKIKGNNKEYALKCVKRKKKFLPSLHDYLIKRGVPLVPTLGTRKGHLLVQEEEYCFLLFPWIKGEMPSYSNVNMIGRISSLLAVLHESSRGYASTGKPVAVKLNQWERHYQYARKQLRELEKLAREQCDGFSKLLLKHLPWLESRIEWVQERFTKGPFQILAKKAERDPIVQHGDYGNHNLLLNEQGDLTIIDLDTAAIALPMWDVSRLITLINHDLQDWTMDRFCAVLKGYQAVRSIEANELELLLLDQVFPHHSVNISISYYHSRHSKPELEELERIFHTDRKKLTELGIGPKQR